MPVTIFRIAAYVLFGGQVVLKISGKGMLDLIQWHVGNLEIGPEKGRNLILGDL
jgi:hypothetical protein